MVPFSFLYSKIQTTWFFPCRFSGSIPIVFRLYHTRVESNPSVSFISNRWITVITTCKPFWIEDESSNPGRGHGTVSSFFFLFFGVHFLKVRDVRSPSEEGRISDPHTSSKGGTRSASPTGLRGTPRVFGNHGGVCSSLGIEIMVLNTFMSFGGTVHPSTSTNTPYLLDSLRLKKGGIIIRLKSWRNQWYDRNKVVKVSYRIHTYRKILQEMFVDTPLKWMLNPSLSINFSPSFSL